MSEVQSVETVAMPESPLDAFRRSAGFQIMFVLHSGLEPGRAVDHLCASAEKMSAALREWQPIETVPRDGTKVLLYTPECSDTGWLAFIAESFYDKRGQLCDTHVSQWQDGLEPTHWMPRPDPPKPV